jgi:hypothetical protein
VVPKFEIVGAERPDLHLPSSRAALDKRKARSHNFNVDQSIGTIVRRIQESCVRARSRMRGWITKPRRAANVRFEDEGDVISN